MVFIAMNNFLTINNNVLKNLPFPQGLSTRTLRLHYLLLIAENRVNAR